MEMFLFNWHFEMFQFKRIRIRLPINISLIQSNVAQLYRNDKKLLSRIETVEMIRFYCFIWNNFILVLNILSLWVHLFDVRDHVHKLSFSFSFLFSVLLLLLIFVFGLLLIIIIWHRIPFKLYRQTNRGMKKWTKQMSSHKPGMCRMYTLYTDYK